MLKQNAFTLIELLVVISVIALLMAMLMPALEQVRNQARSAICESNLRQWGLYWTMYADDHEGSFSEGYWVNWARGEWITVLRSYINTERRKKLLLCPMAKEPHPGGHEYGGPYATYVMGPAITGSIGDENCSYGMNNWMYNPPSHITDIQGRLTELNWRTIDVEGAAKIPVFMDSMWRGGGPGYDLDLVRIEPPAENGEWSGYAAEMHHFCIDRHNGYINCLFLNWSVRKVGLKELWKLKWHREFETGGWTGDWPEWMRKFKDY